jgi:hypothetical protein
VDVMVAVEMRESKARASGGRDLRGAFVLDLAASDASSEGTPDERRRSKKFARHLIDETRGSREWRTGGEREMQTDA